MYYQLMRNTEMCDMRGGEEVNTPRLSHLTFQKRFFSTLSCGDLSCGDKNNGFGTMAPQRATSHSLMEDS